MKYCVVFVSICLVLTGCVSKKKQPLNKKIQKLYTDKKDEYKKERVIIKSTAEDDSQKNRLVDHIFQEQNRKQNRPMFFGPQDLNKKDFNNYFPLYSYIEKLENNIARTEKYVEKINQIILLKNDLNTLLADMKKIKDQVVSHQEYTQERQYRAVCIRNLQIQQELDSQKQQVLALQSQLEQAATQNKKTALEIKSIA